MIVQESEEMYLETLYLLKKKNAAIRSIDIATELNYSRPSVSRAVGLLKEKGYITVTSNGEISFTDSGRKKAEAVYERHIVITDLFIKMGANTATAEDNACRIEHVISSEMFEVLKSFSEKL